MSTYFEGTEKKLELAIAPGFADLRSWGDDYWREIVRSAGATVLSQRSAEQVDAYLLCESSLFVYADRLIMITCGQTDLIRAAETLLERIPQQQLELLIYERKNEVFPHLQPSSFRQDADRLAALVPGRALQFGYEDEHHVFVFYLDQPSVLLDEDRTAELLMYGLAPEICEQFRGGRRAHADPLAAMGLAELLAGYELDDHYFQPDGYSLNAVRGSSYFTVHITPELSGSYASVETNDAFDGRLASVFEEIIQRFRPRSFDTVAWSKGPDLTFPVPAKHQLRSHFVEELGCGYRVEFQFYSLPDASARPAIGIPLASRPLRRPQP